MASYCSYCDPMLRAGFIICQKCRRRSYPAAATWVDEDLVLADFAPACSHVRTRTMLVRPSLLEPCEPEPERQQCAGKVRTGARRGQRCRNSPMPGSDYCTWHAPDRQDAR